MFVVFSISPGAALDRAYYRCDDAALCLQAVFYVGNVITYCIGLKSFTICLDIIKSNDMSLVNVDRL